MNIKVFAIIVLLCVISAEAGGANSNADISKRSLNNVFTQSNSEETKANSRFPKQFHEGKANSRFPKQFHGAASHARKAIIANLHGLHS